MASIIIPWLAVGALTTAGYLINSPTAQAQTSSKNSRNGPPFYTSATTNPINNTSSASTRSAVRGLKHGIVNTSADAQRFQERVRMVSEIARIKQWDMATRRKNFVVVQPNARKPVYVHKW